MREVCKGPAPFFQFDSSKVDASDQPTMQISSNCMTEGPLRGRSIRLIGHTDPRGSARYNDVLGLKRAERVKEYLVHRGIEPERLVVQTAGKDDASLAPADWPSDRRVEIQLVDGRRASRRSVALWLEASAHVEASRCGALGRGRDAQKKEARLLFGAGPMFRQTLG